MSTQGQAEPPAWLREWQAEGATTAEALARFDSLPGVTVAACLGRWRGTSLPTGHPLDGLLESLGWHGKAFRDADTVHPLLFRTRRGAVVALDPIPFLVRPLLRRPALLRHRALAAAFTSALPLLRTSEPRARLRRVEQRGVLSTAMLYDGLPILDLFRAAGPATLLGLMEARGMPQPFFFLLQREAGTA